ncbi:MAG: hypothetical protein A2583_04145 [Bdellovibrionales bacterium RIFOXYD1_FULL_53_11]|nr:MAG: hypothetical protein A2583_04145 [Bdellovibrionales bacterium RIFOXYD1_FULL_53_11]
MIVAGNNHFCAVVPEGIKCWGDNKFGQLGNGKPGSMIQSAVYVQGIIKSPSHITAGANHTCSITQGILQCWGDNKYGQLGIGSDVPFSMAPVVPKAYLPSVKQVVAGDSHTCVLAKGRVWCWGDNSMSQLGLAAHTGSTKPVPIPLPSGDYVAIAGGAKHVCAVSKDAEAYCWGDNSLGQAGQADSSHVIYPQRIESLNGKAKTVFASQSQTCFVAVDGDTFCIGKGFGSNPVRIADKNSKNKIIPDKNTKCSLRADGEMICNNVVVEGYKKGIYSGHVGFLHSCATDHHSVYCWGTNNHGQFGTGNFMNSEKPAITEFPRSHVQSISLGQNHTCAIMNSEVYCWGRNLFGQLGSGNLMDSELPVKTVLPVESIDTLVSGAYHSCILSGGKAWCWGSNLYGQTGLDVSPRKPRVANPGMVVLPGKASFISTGYMHTCAVADGEIYCWGLSYDGQCGIPAGMRVRQPRKVPAGHLKFTAVSASSNYNCAISTQGAVYCWGGDYGNLQEVKTGVPLKSIVTTPVFACGLDASNHLLCWGTSKESSARSAQTIPSERIGDDIISLSAGITEVCVTNKQRGMICIDKNYSITVHIKPEDLDQKN